MPFNPTLPAAGSEISSAELRDQFNALNDRIDALPSPAEGDPLFESSEAALFVAGDKAKLDGALQSSCLKGAGFGDAAANAIFYPAGTMNGKPRYVSPTGYFLVWSPSRLQWQISAEDG